MSTFDTIAGIVERVTGAPTAEITPATTFFETSADSLDHIEIVVEIERDLNLDFDDDDLDLVRNIGELTDLADKMIARKAGKAA